MRKKVSFLMMLILILIGEVIYLTTFKANASEIAEETEEQEEIKEEFCIYNQLPWMIYTEESGEDSKSCSMSFEGE